MVWINTSAFLPSEGLPGNVVREQKDYPKRWWRFPGLSFPAVVLPKKKIIYKLLPQALLWGKFRLKYTLETKIENPSQKCSEIPQLSLVALRIFWKHWNGQSASFCHSNKSAKEMLLFKVLDLESWLFLFCLCSIKWLKL